MYRPNKGAASSLPHSAAITPTARYSTKRIHQPNTTIRGGEEGVLTVEVTNSGDAPAYRVRALSDSDYRYYDERELMFGKIAPGAKVPAGKTYSS